MRNGGFLKTPLKCVLFSNILNCCAMEKKYKIKNNTNINNTLIRESDIISVKRK